MAKEKDDGADRDPESKGEIHKRRRERGEISERYRELERNLSDNPRTDPWAYTALPARNPVKNITPPLWEAIRSEAHSVRRSERRQNFPDVSETPEHRLVEALGRVQLGPYYWSKGTNEALTQNLDGGDATRLYLFFDLSPLAQTGVARAIKKPAVRESPGIDQSVSQPTLNRMPGRMEKQDRHYYASEAETLVRQWQDTKYEDHPSSVKTHTSVV